MMNEWIQDSHPLAIKIHGCILCIRSLCQIFLRVLRGPVRFCNDLIRYLMEKGINEEKKNVPIIFDQQFLQQFLRVYTD